jgi:hypothetical protein
MANSTADALIGHWSERFRKDSLAASIVAALRDRANEIWQGTFELLQRESPEYRNSVDDEFTAESKAHCHELLKTIIAVAAGRANRSGADPFEFVRTHAAWRARHQVPLIASLHAYRLAHRMYWEITRDRLLRHDKQEEALFSLTTLSDFWIQFFDLVGSNLAKAHAVEEGLIVAQSTRSYVGLIDDLLGGFEPRDADSRRLCTVCGIRPGAPLAIAVARPLQPGIGEHIDVEVTLRSWVRLIEQVVPPAVFGRLVDIRNGEVTVIACSDADTGRGILQSLLRNGFPRHAPNGHAVRGGISLDVIEIADLPRSLEEARMALEFASVAKPLMHFSDIELPEFLIRRADRAAVRLIPEWARHFTATEDNQSRELSRTIRAFADCNFNVKRTAQRLGVHTNTVYFRLNRIGKLTGIDPRTYSGTSLLLTTLQLLEIHHGSRQSS